MIPHKRENVKRVGGNYAGMKEGVGDFGETLHYYKAEVGGEMWEVRGQKSEGRSQKAEVRSGMLDVPSFFVGNRTCMCT